MRWPAGVPALDIYNRGQPVHFIQTPNMVVYINELYAQLRHIYLNVPHSEHVTPSWHGESVGHYEGDELVVDTIGLNDRDIRRQLSHPPYRAGHRYGLCEPWAKASRCALGRPQLLNQQPPRTTRHAGRLS
jgi:hypothetical protein